MGPNPSEGLESNPPGEPTRAGTVINHDEEMSQYATRLRK
jgi:hypothetical protein